MNPQERELLGQLLKQLAEAKISAKDDEAEAMIREATQKQPDAAYLLVQRALLLEHALGVSKARNEELQNQVQSLQAGQKSSFLDNNPWTQPSSAPNPAPVGNRQYPHQSTQPLLGSNLFGGGSTFLGNMATTAAGVVAGSFLFQGIENLMGHHNQAFGSHTFMDDQVPNSTVINNYFGDDVKTGMANNEDDDSYQQASFADDDNQNDDIGYDSDSGSDDSSWI